ncbi:uncharacterized protein LOC136084902 [Hydra vulgaris]|uniref:uncharacterized protein LOC136084902 n=1 Tax=Hydra vulgaris TaxID=6087 RepID=UPI0032EA6F5C
MQALQINPPLPYLFQQANLKFRGSDAAIGLKSNGNFLEVFELLVKYDIVLNTLMQRIQDKETKKLYTLFSLPLPRWEILKFSVAVSVKPQSDNRWESRIICVKPLYCYLKEILEAIDCLKEHDLEKRDRATTTEYGVLFQINKSSKLSQCSATSLDILASEIKATNTFLYEYCKNGFSDARYEIDCLKINDYCFDTVRLNVSLFPGYCLSVQYHGNTVEKKNFNEFKIHINLDEKIEDFEISKYSLAKQEAHKQNVCPSLIRETIVFKEMSELLYSKNIEPVQATSYFDINELFDMKLLKTKCRFTRKSKEHLAANEISQTCIHKTKRGASEMLLKTVTVNERASLPLFHSLVNFHEITIYDTQRKCTLSAFGNQSSIKIAVDNNCNAEHKILEKSVSSPNLSTLGSTKSQALPEVCVQSKNVDIRASLPLINSLLTLNANNMIYNQDNYKKKCNKLSHRPFVQNLSSNVSKIDCDVLIEDYLLTTQSCPTDSSCSFSKNTDKNKDHSICKTLQKRGFFKRVFSFMKKKIFKCYK